jgi:mRNA interferase RelE/StbE
MLKVVYKNTPMRVLRRMQPQVARQIRNKIMAVAADPSNPSLGVRPLKNRPGFRLRIGPWRVIFDKDATTLKVLAIETRGDAYKPRKRR